MRLRLILPLVLGPALVLAGCQAIPGLGRSADTQSAAASDIATAADAPITGGAIAVTSLDGPAAPAAPPSAAQAAAPTAEDAPAALAPLAGSVAEATAQAGLTTDAAVAESVAPTVIKTAAHLACERRGGRWSVAGGGSAAFCQMPTRDAGKSCRSASDCTGYCLEKSRTCSPVTPMLGCHDILNETGRMLTQCIN